MGGPVAERWRRYETDAEDSSAEPIAFDFYWRSLEQAAITLGAGHGELLGRLESAAQLGAAASSSSASRATLHLRATRRVFAGELSRSAAGTLPVPVATLFFGD
jgi:hypothetical protein